MSKEVMYCGQVWNKQVFKRIYLSLNADNALKRNFLSCSFVQGRELFVGLSSRTNVLGAQEVAKAFPEYPTTTVKVHAPAIHLKDCFSMAGPEIMAVSKSEHAQKTFKVSAVSLDTFWNNLFCNFFLTPYCHSCLLRRQTKQPSSSIYCWKDESAIVIINNVIALRRFKRLVHSSMNILP